MQSGQIIRRGNSWLLRYWEEQQIEGQTVRRRVCRKIATVSDQYRSEASLRDLVKLILEPVNVGSISAGGETFQQFIEAKYLPYAKGAKRPSTYKGYFDLYNLRVQPHIGGIKLRDFRAVQAQRLLNTLAKPRTLTTRTLLRVKSFLCAVLSYAIREGHIQPPNPLHGRGVIVIEGGLASEDTYAYDLTEIGEMLATLTNKTHQTAVAVAGFSGLSLAELRGLRWENIGKDVLTVQRTYWHREEGETKTAARKAEVPLIPQVAEILRAHRKRNPKTTFVFEGPYFHPLDLATMGSKAIKKALLGTVEWHGWHALRRGLGSNLHELGVPDKTIQAILRHSNVSVTQGYYIKSRQRAGVDAMKKLSAALLKLGKVA